jgi:uncharacterized protein YjiS (DUF1127 family)
MRFLHGSIVPLRYCAPAAFAYLSLNESEQKQTRTSTQMAYATQATQTHGTLVARFNVALDSIRARFERHRVYKNTLAELESLSSRELADLGLSRGMLARIAHQAAYEG